MDVQQNDEYVEKTLFLYIINETRILYAHYWKTTDIPSIEEWWTFKDFAEIDKLMALLKEKSTEHFIKNWKPIIDIPLRERIVS